MKILVTGGNGQLGTEIKSLSSNKYEWVFTDLPEMDITGDIDTLLKDVEDINPDFIVNCAAYTAVDKAEEESDLAFKINEKGPENLAKCCSDLKIGLAHISTDFVFDGQKNTPYKESDATAPLSVYGTSKLAGEKIISENHDSYYIIRTSWLYGIYGTNFVKTMLRLGKERGKLGVIADQIGTPTHTFDLVALIEQIIGKQPQYGLYHFSNEGVASWYDFAHSIFDLASLNIELSAIDTSAYPTPAIRPAFSVMDKAKLKSELDYSAIHWRDSLATCLRHLI